MGPAGPMVGTLTVGPAGPMVGTLAVAIVVVGTLAVGTPATPAGLGRPALSSRRLVRWRFLGGT